MKRPIALLVILVGIIAGVSALKAQSSNGAGNFPGVQAKGAVLMESKSGEILYAKGEHSRLYPASTTKILTALIAMEKGDLAEQVTVGKEIKYVKNDGSRAGLRPGEKISLANLIRGLMLPSGNDAAYTIAEHIGRKVSRDKSITDKEAIFKFVDLMNQRAAQLGAAESHFTNPHGYHYQNHYTTPYDLALIAREAMKHEFFREVVKTAEYRTPNGLHQWTNRNELINSRSPNFFSYATGIKTGHTGPAGYCLVSAASKDGRDVLAVMMGAPTSEEQWQGTRRMLEYGLEQKGFWPPDLSWLKGILR